MIRPKGLYVHHFQNTETKLKSQMSAGHPTVSQNVQRNREGEDGHREASPVLSLNHHPGVYQQAGGSNSPYS